MKEPCGGELRNNSANTDCDHALTRVPGVLLYIHELRCLPQGELLAPSPVPQVRIARSTQ